MHCISKSLKAASAFQARAAQETGVFESALDRSGGDVMVSCDICDDVLAFSEYNRHMMRHLRDEQAWPAAVGLWLSVACCSVWWAWSMPIAVAAALSSLRIDTWRH